MAEPARSLEEFTSEELEEELSPAVIRLLELSRELAERIIERVAPLTGSDKLSELRSVFKPRSFTTSRRRVPGVAVDSTYPPEGGADLVLARLVAAVAGYVCFHGAVIGGGQCREAYARAWLLESEEERQKLPLMAKSLEKAVAIRVLRSSSNLKLLLLDGEITPYPLLFKSTRSIARSRLLSRLDKQSCLLLEEAARRGVAVAGIVKRSYTRMASAITGYKTLNDKALFTLLLDPGSYAVLGSYSSVLPVFAEHIAKEKGLDPRRYRGIVEERLTSCKHYGSIVTVFYRPTRPHAAPAVKLEVFNPEPLGSVEAVVELLDGLTNPATGLPYPIDVVDEYVRIEARAVELLRRRIIAVLARYADEAGALEAIRLLAHTNPEKRYLYEPRRLRWQH